MTFPHSIRYSLAGAELPAVVVQTARCMQCGRLFEQQEMRRITCSDHCRAAYLADEPRQAPPPAPEAPTEPVNDSPAGECVMCGQPFRRYGMDVRSKTCSEDRWRAHRRAISQQSLRRIALRSHKRSHESATGKGLDK